MHSATLKPGLHLNSGRLLEKWSNLMRFICLTMEESFEILRVKSLVCLKIWWPCTWYFMWNLHRMLIKCELNGRDLREEFAKSPKVRRNCGHPTQGIKAISLRPNKTIIACTTPSFMYKTFEHFWNGQNGRKGALECIEIKETFCFANDISPSLMILRLLKA